MTITDHTLHRSGRAGFPHPALALADDGLGLGIETEMLNLARTTIFMLGSQTRGERRGLWGVRLLLTNNSSGNSDARLKVSHQWGVSRFRTVATFAGSPVTKRTLFPTLFLLDVRKQILWDNPLRFYGLKM